MVGEAPGPVNFTQMVTLFAEKMSGGKYLEWRIRLDPAVFAKVGFGF